MRECGECSLCCKLVGVHEINKLPDEWCCFAHKERRRGCKEYVTRPESCRQFTCLWQTEQIKESLSPRETKVICAGGTSVFGPTVYVYMQKDSHLYAFQRSIECWMDQGVLVCVVFGRSRRWIVPEARRLEVMKFLEEQDERERKVGEGVGLGMEPVPVESVVLPDSAPGLLVRDEDVQLGSGGPSGEVG